MTDLAKLIHFWEVALELQGYLMSPSAQVQVKATIKFLRELEQMKGE